MPEKAPQHPHPTVHFILEILPLLVFFVAYRMGGLQTATFAIMAVTAASVTFHYLTTRRVPFLTIITAAVVTVFGSLTLWLHNDAFIKMKPAMVYLIFAALIAGGRMAGHNPMQRMFGHAFALTETGWCVLSWRWFAFFMGMAGLNEALWRGVSEQAWITFKVFGAVPTMIAFTLLQWRLLQREKLSPADPEQTEAPADVTTPERAA